MSSPTSPTLSADEWRVNLLKDGGRRVMHCGNAYEDDLEPAASPAAPAPDGGTSPGAVRPYHE